MIGAPPGSVSGSAGPQPVLIEKGSPFVAQDFASVHPDTTQNPADTRGFNSVLVDMLPGAGALATSLTVLGSPSQGGPWVQEVDPQAFQSGIVATAPHRYLVANVSLWVAVALSNPAGWRIVLTPLNAASTTTVTLTGTSTTNVAQYGGVAVGPTNPLDVRPSGAIDVADRAARLLGVASVTSAPYRRGALTDRSGTITTGGTAQQIAAANAARNYFFFENLSTADLWINFGVAAALTQPSLKVPSGGSFVMEADFIDTELVSVIGATTGQAFTAKEG